MRSRPSATVTPPPGETFRTYSYDPVGNRLSEASDAGTTTYAYDAADRLSSVTPPGQSAIAYNFDDNGNQTAAGAETFAWDLADRMVSATVGGTTETYTWAGDGRRLSATSGGSTTAFVWDTAFGLPQLALERDGSGNLLRAYRYGLDLLSETAGSSTAWYHFDGLGSVTDLTDPAGASLAWSEVYPFGLTRLAGSGLGSPGVQPFEFTGEQLDSVTGLYHLRARQYDPTTGRFLGVDPVASPLTDPYAGSYVYVRNRPTVAVDPSGEFLNIVGGFVAGTIAYGAGTIIGNAIQGNDLREGLNAADAFMAWATGALMAGTAGMGLLVQTSVGASLGGITTAASMGLSNRRDPTEMAWGALFGMAGPVADVIPVPFLNRVTGVGLGRGILTSTFLNSGQNILTTEQIELASHRSLTPPKP